MLITRSVELSEACSSAHQTKGTSGTNVTNIHKTQNERVIDIQFIVG